ncbi:MAG: transketolase C-terminal domain-containing protein [Patescibacteria group bacterium]
MINPSQKLNPKLFDKDIEYAEIRKGFGDGLVKSAEIDKRVVALCADLTESTRMEAFKQKFPDRFIEIGVAEQNLASVASGMASMGKIPFITSYAMFSPGRNWEQIRTTICYNDRPVKIVGSHAGVSVGPDGGTHQAIEDIAITRVIPNMVVISPCDAIEARKATIACAKTKMPTYLRLAREKTPLITTNETPFEIGKAQVLFFSKDNKGNEIRADVGIIATGALVYKALKVAQDFEKGNDGVEIKVKVLNLSTIKPLDDDSVWRLAHETGAIVTVEEHQIAGGMGSAVAECLARHYPVPMEFVGVKDKFGQSGKPDELLEHYGMGEKDIKEAVRRVIMRKTQ